MLIALAVITLCAVLAFVLIYPLTPGFSRRPGRHRGTPGQLMLQEAQRAERMTEWAHGVLTEV